jgi:hypothetical protein
LLAPLFTLALRLTGSGGVGVAEVLPAGPDCCEPVPPGEFDVPPQAARMVASTTIPTTPDSLRISLVGINVLTSGWRSTRPLH